MSVLRPTIRRTKAFGAQLLARVEEVNLGLTTVRLASGGARLTNLPTMGDVSPGDLVIVDYATGDPYVRQTTIGEPTPSELELSLAIAPDADVPVPTGNPAVSAVKLQGSAQPAQSWQYIGYQWRWWSREVQFGTAIFDPDKLSNGTGLTFKSAGVYFWYAVIAGGVTNYVADEVGWPAFEVWPVITAKSGSLYTLASWKTIRSYSGTAVIVNLSGIYPFSIGEQLSVYTQYDDYNGAGQLIYGAGLYPVIAAWKVNALKNIRRITAS